MYPVITSFEDSAAWQKAKELTIAIHGAFQNGKDFALKDQVQRASVSLNNIAEGFEWQSNREFRQFLFIAKGSCEAVRSMLRLAEKLGFLTIEETNKLINEALEISRMLSGLVKKL
jgi:four helix bundle protein